MPYESYKIKKEEQSSKRLVYLYIETSTIYYRNAIITTRKAIVINITTNAISYTNYRVVTIINLYHDLYYPGVRAKRIPNTTLFVTTKIILRETANSVTWLILCLSRYLRSCVRIIRRSEDMPIRLTQDLNQIQRIKRSIRKSLPLPKKLHVSSYI